jgi:predicted oxidoreductase
MYSISLAPNFEASALVLGCMRIGQLDSAELDAYLRHSLDLGITLFDHADIYGSNGGCETLFGDWLRANPSMREKMLLQSKCGIVQNEKSSNVSFDFSHDHIIASLENSLRRLHTDHLEIYLLHRPDALVEPEEVAQAFDELSQSGKVRYFGVSNMNASQVTLLQASLSQKLIVNQLQFGPAHTGMIDHAIRMNTKLEYSEDHDSGTLDYCRLHGLTIQAWSPYQHSQIHGTFIDHPKFAELNHALAEVGKKYGLTKNGVVAAWIARHPAKIQVIAGTMNAERLSEIAVGMDVKISREDWYRIYATEGRELP